MLRVGLTGGIGSGKSTVARRLEDLGATVVDADQLAREVVEPGTVGLRGIVDRFGADILLPDGTLDRAGLGRIVFSDKDALDALEAITHPAIWELTATRMEAARRRGIAVHDMPLIVEKHLCADYHLVVLVDTPAEVRLQRLVELRGMEPADALARIASQASDEERYAAADVILRNTGTEEQLIEDVDRLWEERLVPFDRQLIAGVVSRRSEAIDDLLREWDPSWPATGERIIARLRAALGERALSIDHVGSTAIPGLLAKDVIDIQIGVKDLLDADRPSFVDAMAAAGFPRAAGHWWDSGADGKDWPKRVHGNADPGRIVHVHVREHGSEGWVWSLRFRDWMCADKQARERYAQFKRDLATRLTRTTDYAAAKEPWFRRAHTDALSWDARSGWSPRSG